MFKKSIIAVLVSTMLGSSVVSASTQTQMQAWFNSMGSYANLTGAQVVNGQTSTTYTGGNMFVRTPTQNYQIASLAAPSINGGCGGIDLFAGSFSFINSAQLTAMLRNIGNNAVNYAFMLAIKSASPQMADLLQYLQDQASKLNNLNVNSCHAAEGIVNAIAGPALTDKKEQANAQGTGSTVSNIWSDSFQSLDQWRASSAAKKQARDAASAADPNLAAMLNPGNIVYAALQQSNVPSDLYPLMMGLTGAIIIKPAASTGNNGLKPQWTYVPPTGLTFKDFIGDPAVQTTTQLMGLSCDPAPGCMNPSQAPFNVESLAFDVKKTISAGMNNISNRNAQTFSPSDMTLFTNTTIPLYKLARIAAQNNNLPLTNQYAQVIAIELAYNWMNSVLQNINAVLATSSTTSQSPDVVEAMKLLTTQISSQTQLASLDYQAAYKNVTAITSMQTNLKRINDEMLSALNPSIQNSIIKYSK